MGWEFIFLGANIDAVETAGHFGISADRAQNFLTDSDGVELNFKVERAKPLPVCALATAMPKDWGEEIKRTIKTQWREIRK